MISRQKTIVPLLATILVAVILPLTVFAQGRGNGNRNGGGGGNYTLIALPDSVSGVAGQISKANGLHQLRDGHGDLVEVDVVGSSADQTHYWALDSSARYLSLRP